MKSRRNKSRVVVRVKMKRRRYKLALLALFLLGAASAVFSVSGRIRDSIAALSGSGSLKWQLRSVDADSVDARIRPEILKMLRPGLGKAWSSGDSSRLVSGLYAGYPFLERVEVSRNWLNGQLRITALKRRPAGRAMVNGEDVGFIGEDGKIFKAPSGFYPEDLAVVRIAGKSSGDLRDVAKLAMEIGAAGNSLPAALESINCSAQDGSCVLLLAGGSEIKWGEYAFAGEKISRLNQVFEDARHRMPGPVRADLRYFRDGRILISRMPVR
ncbi:MAG: cell division protein FtsQ/DivIB [bacterium]